MRHHSAETSVKRLGEDGTAAWGEQICVHATDPSSVLVVEVFDVSTWTSKRLVGQWLTTMKFFKVRPDWNFHEELDVSGQSGAAVVGWFQLMNAHKLGHGKCGSIKLHMSWLYACRFDVTSPSFDRTVLPPNLTAMQQLQQNSDETALKLGNVDLVANMLRAFPLTLHVKRCTLREMHVFLGDLFSGFTGSEELGRKDKAITVNCIDVSRALKPRSGTEGITVWDFCYRFWVNGVAPKVVGSRKLIHQGLSSVIYNGLGGLVSLMHGTDSDVGLGR